MPDHTAIGACLCGAVGFELEPPSNWVAHCHCSMCRRAHGAPFVTWVSVPPAQLRVVRGGDVLTRYPSSDGATRSFCGRCGSSLFFESTRWAGEVHVARACIPGPIDRAPQVHAFFSDRAPWISISDGLPHRGGPSGIEPID
jgi:hypothetical protein